MAWGMEYSTKEESDVDVVIKYLKKISQLLKEGGLEESPLYQI